MIDRLLADAVVTFHAAFVLFVVFGGFLVIRWPGAAWLHLPAVAWAVTLEFAGWICPLTPLENTLRARAGLTTYEGDFLGAHLLPLLYPDHLTRAAQLVLGTVALGLNLALYIWIHRRSPTAESV